MAFKSKINEAPSPNLAKQTGAKIGDISYSSDMKTKYTVDDIDLETGQVSWAVTSLPGLDKLNDNVNELVSTAKGVYSKTKGDDEFRKIYEEAKLLRNRVRKHLRNQYPDEYKKMTNESELGEMSTSAGAGAYNTKYAFKLPKKQKKIEEDKSYARISKPRFVKDKNNPNFLNVYIDYDLGPGGNSIAFGKETMTGQIRRLSSAKARKVAHDIALDLEANFNLEDIEVTDLENGKVRIFAVSDDFINGIKENIGATLGPGPKAGPEGVKDNFYVKTYKYKLVPKDKNGNYVQKGSGLEVKNL